MLGGQSRVCIAIVLAFTFLAGCQSNKVKQGYSNSTQQERAAAASAIAMRNYKKGTNNGF